MMTETKPESEATTNVKPKRPKKIALRFDPYQDGCKDLGGDPAFPPLRRRIFGMPRTTKSGEVEFVSITLHPQPQLGLDAALWEDLKKNIPVIERLLRKGAIEEYYPSTDSRADSTAGYDADTAQMLVESTKSRDRLRTWAKIETRQSVQDAIDAQLLAIEQGDV